MNIDKIKSVILEAQEELAKLEGQDRADEERILKSIGSKPLKIVTGFRRAGKSFLVQKVAQKLIRKKIFEPEDILYLNFEDYALSEINDAHKLGLVLSIFEALRETKGSRRKLLIFDEIQNVNNWDKFIRTIYEKNHNNIYEIIITGSNSQLLSSELGSNLAGRFIEFHVYPFSFAEVLVYRRLHITDEKQYLKHKQEIMTCFQQYLNSGGLPETLTISDPQARLSYLSGILSKVVLDDLIKRFKPKHPEIIDKLVAYFLANIGNITSIKNISNHLKAQDVDIDINSLAKYVDYIPKTFTLYELNKFDWTTKKIFNTSKKYFAVDLGITNLYKPAVSNFNKQLENLVFMELKRRETFNELHYGLAQNKEIDFIYIDQSQCITKYQITLTLNAENIDRELSAFKQADPFLDGKKNMLLSLDDDECDLEYKGIRVIRKNLMKWLC
jgi:predicted AAA+ superfamily ATPase